MTIKELIALLGNYPEDMEVVLYRPECKDEEYYDAEFYVETNDNDQLVID